MGWKYRVKQLVQRFISVHKSVYYRLDKKQIREWDNKAGVVTASPQEIAIEEVVSGLYPDSPKALTFYQDYVRQGIEHWTALHRGNVAGVVWLYTGWYLAQWEGYDAWLLHIDIEPDAKFVCNVFVEPQLRGQNIFPLIAQRCFIEYPDSIFYSCVASSNKSSRRSHEKIGFRQWAAVYYVRLLQITFCYCAMNAGKRRFFRMTKGKEINISLTEQ